MGVCDRVFPSIVAWGRIHTRTPHRSPIHCARGSGGLLAASSPRHILLYKTQDYATTRKRRPLRGSTTTVPASLLMLCRVALSITLSPFTLHNRSCAVSLLRGSAFGSLIFISIAFIPDFSYPNRVSIRHYVPHSQVLIDIECIHKGDTTC